MHAGPESSSNTVFHSGRCALHILAEFLELGEHAPAANPQFAGEFMNTHLAVLGIYRIGGEMIFRVDPTSSVVLQ